MEKYYTIFCRFFSADKKLVTFRNCLERRGYDREEAVHTIMNFRARHYHAQYE